MKKGIHPIVGEVFYFEATVLRVRFKKDDIIVRLRERHSNTEFNLVYKQQTLPGMEASNGNY